MEDHKNYLERIYILSPVSRFLKILSEKLKVTVQGIVKQPAALTLWKSSPGAGEREKHCPS
jgi:hypothetical protein